MCPSPVQIALTPIDASEDSTTVEQAVTSRITPAPVQAVLPPVASATTPARTDGLQGENNGSIEDRLLSTQNRGFEELLCLIASDIAQPRR